MLDNSNTNNKSQTAQIVKVKLRQKILADSKKKKKKLAA